MYIYHGRSVLQETVTFDPNIVRDVAFDLLKFGVTSSKRSSDTL